MISHEESKIQRECVKWFRYQHQQLFRRLFSVPNGLRTNSIVQAQIAKAEGLMAGVADLLLLVPRGRYHLLAIEMKTPKGKQSESQKEWQRDIEKDNYKYVICRSVDDFMREIKDYLKTI